MNTVIASSMYDQNQVDANTRVRAGVGLIIRNLAGDILLERRSDNGLWGLPGGRIEPGESITQTALREAQEETGLTIVVTRLLGVYSGPENRIVIYPDNVVQLIDILLEAAIVSGDLVCSSESLELRFFQVGGFPPETEIAPPAWLPLREAVAGDCGMIH
jgi:8-oxo-dGTP pyrophosphatase MutT (NUDIX family)